MNKVKFSLCVVGYFVAFAYQVNAQNYWDRNSNGIYYDDNSRPNVGIGLYNPQHLLHVNGNALLGNIFIENGGLYFNPYGPSLLKYENNEFLFGDQAIRINQNGRVGIGMSPSSQYDLSVNGSINVTELYVNGNPLSGGGDQQFFDVTSGDGNGIRFGGSDNYKIHKGSGSGYTYGPVSSSSIKMNMNGSSSNGWTWGVNGSTPIAGLNTQGNMKIEGAMESSSFNIIAGNGYGLKFWNSDTYKIHMGSGSEYFYGPVSDYSIKMNMSSGTPNRGWTWGVAGATPVAAINTGGTMKIAGTMEASAFLVNGVPIGGGGTQWTTAGSNISYSTGAVGIGTAPTQTLDVVGRTQIRSSSQSAGTWYADNSGAASAFFGLNGTAHTSAIGIYHGSQWRLLVNSSGYVGIGTSTPDSELTVKGTIHTQEVKVDLNGSVAPDYVFEKNYSLTSLEELKTYIEANKHLPEVPSAKQMEKEGINLKEMNLILLKKVEELTLHVIDLKGEINDLKKAKE